MRRAWGLIFHKIQGHRVDAVTQPCWFGAVIEDMPLVAATAGAFDFGAHHAITAVCVLSDAVCGQRLVKRGPTCTGVELGG